MCISGADTVHDDYHFVIATAPLSGEALQEGQQPASGVRLSSEWTHVGDEDMTEDVLLVGRAEEEAAAAAAAAGEGQSVSGAESQAGTVGEPPAATPVTEIT